MHWRETTRGKNQSGKGDTKYLIFIALDLKEEDEGENHQKEKHI